VIHLEDLCQKVRGPLSPSRAQLLTDHTKRQMSRDMAASETVVPEQWDCVMWARNSPELKAAMGF
jgi:hypothetical protein